MASVERNSYDDVISKHLLKSKSGEFDVESIHTLSLKKAGIVDLGCISECIYLQCLDLSNNSINQLHKLSGLITLTHLNLSANRLTSLEGLQSLENLQNLNVCGNLLASLDALRAISGLTKLTNLGLQDQSSGLTNPLCNSSYVQRVLTMLPMLNTLDGQRIRGRGSELFHLCQEIDKTLNNLSSVHPCDMDNHSRFQGPETVMQKWMMDDQGQDKVIEAEQHLRGESPGNVRDSMKKRKPK